MPNTIKSTAPVVHDPLLDAINAYRAGVIDYNTNSGPWTGMNWMHTQMRLISSR